MPSAKIAVIGDINGQFRTVFQKLGTLHNKNAFSFALVVGSLFADLGDQNHDQDLKDLINNEIEIPLPVYFVLGTHALPQLIIERLSSPSNEDGSVCPNLFFLGKRSTTKTSEGVRIVTLGGIFSEDVSSDGDKDKFSSTYTEQDAKILRGANKADILITSTWPTGIKTGSKASLPGDGTGSNPEAKSQTCIAELCDTLRPRYHFSTSGDVFYEREPFFHTPKEDAPGSYDITRFISLAKYGNEGKQKWIYAFSLDTAAPLVTSIPAGTTASPLTSMVGAAKKRGPLPDQQTSYQRYDTTAGDSFERPRKRHKHAKGREKAAPPTQSECYFCLSNPNLPTHLVTSIGSEAYLTTAKGPLTTSTTFASIAPDITFPSHILIIPMTHSPTLSLIPDTEARENTRREMEKYRKGIEKMLGERSKGKLGALTWEISRASGFHTHWQTLPLPQNLISKGLIEAAFKVEAANKSHPHLEKGDPDEGVDYFRVWIHDAEKKSESSLHFALDAGFRDLQYARRVAAKLLGLEGRVMWQDCGQTEVEETRDAEGFKEAFKEYDFTEEE